MQVLLVTKDEDRASGLRESIAKAGHQVSRVPSPSEGLAQAKESPPDCVVLEGEETGEDLKSFRASLESRVPDRAVPVLPLGPEDDPEAIVRGIAAIVEAEESGTADAAPVKDEAASPEGAADSSPKADSAGSAPKTVLLIDDREVQRRRTATQLSNEGWRVLEAEDGRKGALLIIDEQIDCILVNGIVGGKTTHGVVRSAAEIRKVHPRPYSILVMTDSDDAALIAETLKAGADDVVVRAAGPQVLHRRLGVAYRTRTLLRENRRLKERLAALEAKAS